ncbi:Dimethyladenosine transferase [Methylophaga frappieri]|uniref:Ribosomal RNA small subunit methyltransferase A n=1 Tax=Methylophaga frappieri (strain ATCC BAA-2434 / DSM 25690 / JAM7) TaxID=754477 RepID=I1YL40_METFJ|nr:16S rRNA (adenine(1518)-N(6)/adenine(1519)-N(6))-dimethyltransferase RsmA [Methylophaga frappieri]AFJ03633.1 Dimethyladenosine transferase [Methylophaga frappieri]
MKPAYPKARKRFGQNFLQDAGIIDAIISAIAPEASQHLVEIGPGRGALTGPLLASGARLDVIELDRDLLPLLTAQYEQESQFRIHQADALKVDFRQLQQNDEKLRVIGNLPYNISTPILFHLLQHADIIEDMCFMLQKEVVERICATPSSKQYGRLSVMIQCQCETAQLLSVPPEAFEPVPKVHSAIVYLRPASHFNLDNKALGALNKLVTQAFSQRRKTIANTLKNIVSQAVFEAAGIEPSQRPETISVSQYVHLQKILAEQEKSTLTP